jgi:hypothetical protein
LLVEDVEEKLLVQTWQLAVGGDGEELVGEIHEDTVIAGGVVGERGFEFGGHEAGIARGLKQVVEAG